MQSNNHAEQTIGEKQIFQQKKKQNKTKKKESVSHVSDIPETGIHFMTFHETCI